jgi:hypothetical protein
MLEEEFREVKVPSAVSLPGGVRDFLPSCRSIKVLVGCEGLLRMFILLLNLSWDGGVPPISCNRHSVDPTLHERHVDTDRIFW